MIVKGDDPKNLCNFITYQIYNIKINILIVINYMIDKIIIILILTMKKEEMKKLYISFIPCISIILFSFISSATAPRTDAQCGSKYDGIACEVGGTYGNITNCKYNIHLNHTIDSECKCDCRTPDGVILGPPQHQWKYNAPANNKDCQKIYNNMACQSGTTYGNNANCKYNMHRSGNNIDSLCECDCIDPDGTNLGLQHQIKIYN